MSKAQEFKTITDEVNEARRKQEEAEMNAFWSESLTKLEKCAREGRNFGYIDIPCRFDATYILALAEIEEFKIERTSSREYKISW